MNTIRTKQPPEGNFTEVTRQDEKEFIELVKKRQGITYTIATIGDLPRKVYDELMCQGYVECFVDGSNQRYLIAE